MKARRINTAEQIASWIAHVAPDEIPGDVLEKGKEHLLDGFAAIIAGSREDASRQIDEYLRSLGSSKNSTVVGSGMRVAAEHAALANGVRGHVLDYDDAQLASLSSRPFGQLTHPTTPVLAATLALAESVQASGAALLRAYIIGLEIACRIADALDPRHYLNGFHATGTIGAFGATAGCAHLLALSELQVNRALGICGSLASGIRAQRGTMTKALNAGHAAQNGVMAASLAKNGFTASENVFDDPMGYVNAACYGQMNKRLIRLGKPFFLIDPGIAVKRYPSPSVMHPALDAIIDLANTHTVDPAEVKNVKVALGNDAALPLVYKEPRTPLEAKFSLQFSAAVALLHRKAGLSEYSDAELQRREIIALMKTVEIVRSAKLNSRGDSGARTEVRIALRDGRTYRARAQTVKGHPRKPLSRLELEQKFRECAETIPSKRAEAFIRQLWWIEEIPRLTPWLELLSPHR